MHSEHRPCDWCRYSRGLGAKYSFCITEFKRFAFCSQVCKEEHGKMWWYLFWQRWKPRLSWLSKPP